MSEGLLILYKENMFLSRSGFTSSDDCLMLPNATLLEKLERLSFEPVVSYPSGAISLHVFMVGRFRCLENVLFETWRDGSMAYALEGNSDRWVDNFPLFAAELTDPFLDGFGRDLPFILGAIRSHCQSMDLFLPYTYWVYSDGYEHIDRDGRRFKDRVHRLSLHLSKQPFTKKGFIDTTRHQEASMGPRSKVEPVGNRFLNITTVRTTELTIFPFNQPPDTSTLTQVSWELISVFEVNLERSETRNIFNFKRDTNFNSLMEAPVSYNEPLVCNVKLSTTVQ